MSSTIEYAAREWFLSEDPLPDLVKLREAIVFSLQEQERPEARAYLKHAQECCHRDGEVEIDEGAVVSLAEDKDGIHGAYVHAWIWIDKEDLK